MTLQGIFAMSPPDFIKLMRATFHALLLMFITATGSADLPKDAERLDVKLGQRVQLKTYNGPDVDLIIRSSEVSAINIMIVDNERKFGTILPTSGGQTMNVDGVLLLKSAVTTKAVEKKNGIPVSGTAAQAYLIFEHKSGLKVYFFDTLATKQNECALFIVPAPPPAIGEAPRTTKQRLQELEELRKNNLISETEYQKKRQDILAGL